MVGLDGGAAGIVDLALMEKSLLSASFMALFGFWDHF